MRAELHDRQPFGDNLLKSHIFSVNYGLYIIHDNTDLCDDTDHVNKF